jgi:hypothetical protein
MDFAALVGMTKRHMLLVAAGLLVMALAPAVPARAAQSSAYTPMDKLGRGVAGMVGGILELPGNMVEESNHDGPKGLPSASPKGSAWSWRAS